MFALELGDGANALAIEAVAADRNPGVQIKLPDYPETDGRWRTAPVAPDGWQTTDFDDLKWVSPSVADGWMWSKPGAARACFRQVLLWSRTFYGGKLASIIPPHTEYGISPNTTEVFQHAIYAPTAVPIASYILQVEVPVGFRLLDTTCPTRRPYCWHPDAVTSRRIRVADRDYLQYNLTFAAAKLPATCVALLPIKHDTYARSDGTATIRFRRLINGNITELTTPLALRLLPPVDGRTMKSILYAQYDHQSHRSISAELHTELVKQSVAAGMDVWFCGPNHWSDKSSVHQRIRANGGRITAIPPEGHPLWGAARNTELRQLVESNTEYHAVYFQNTGPRVKNWSFDFCPTYALGAGHKRFAHTLLRDYQKWKAVLPDADDLFFNDERYPWQHMGTNIPPGLHCSCFCQRCKRAFRQFAGLAEATELADQTILDKYREKWALFWKHNRDRLLVLVKATANKAGFKTIYYHNTHDRDTWRTKAGKADRFTVGFPGGAAFVDRNSQPGLDHTMDFFRSVGIGQFQGQRRTYFPFRPDRRRAVSTKDGWAVNPKHLKLEIVRMAATTHGGVLYESVMQLSGGCLYYLGEATRLIAAYEDVFHNGSRQDALADCGDYKYPDILVLTTRDERLVLVFNETTQPKRLLLNNHRLKPGQHAKLFGKPGTVANPASMHIVVPPEDVAAIHIE